jgi:hypothetical protein
MRKPNEVYEDYEVSCPLGDRIGTVLGQCDGALGVDELIIASRLDRPVVDAT